VSTSQSPFEIVTSQQLLTVGSLATCCKGLISPAYKFAKDKMIK